MTDNRRDQEVGEWLAHPQTEEFFRYVSAQAEYVDTVGRASAYIPGEPLSQQRTWLAYRRRSNR